MKTANVAVLKWTTNAAAAASDYLDGARTTDKDQSTRAIAAIPLMQAGLNAAFAAGRIAKGLTKSGKAGWFKGVEEKGAQNFATGVSAPGSQQKYVTNSGRYDAARKASDSMPRGPRGSAQNLAKVATVANALRAIKVA